MAIEDILNWRNISASVQRVLTGIPNRLPPAFMNIKEDVLGDRTTYVQFYGQRALARRAEYGAPSRARTLRPLADKTVTLCHFAEHIKLRHELLLRLRNPNDLVAQTMAQTEIARHGADLRTLFDNTRIAAIASALANGRIWFDVGGNVLPTASGAFHTIDYRVPANNLNQLNGIIAASWATASTPIIQQIENLRIRMAQTTGRELKYCLYGSNIANYLFTNDTLKAYWQYAPAMYQSFANSPETVPNGFAGLTWIRVGDMFFEDADGVSRSLFGADTASFMPEIDSNFYTMYEGSILVPKSYGISANSTAALSNFEIVYGMGGYAVPELDPVGIKETYFDTFLPHFKIPEDLYIGDVTP